MNKSKDNIFIQEKKRYNVNYDDKCIIFISKIISFFINKNSFTLSNNMRLS